MSNNKQNEQKPNEAKKILILCEGLEEKMYFERLNELDVWSHNFKVEVKNAEGSGNLYVKFTKAVRDRSYNIVLIVCDTELDFCNYTDLRDKITEKFSGKTADKVVFFCNPCSLQIVLSHFKTDDKEDRNLKTNDKFKNRGLVRYYTGVDGYNGEEPQLEDIYRKLTKDNYQLMLEKVGKISTDINTVPSTNILEMFLPLGEKNRKKGNKWIKDIQAVIYLSK
ncbi:MAG: hypothetical protein LUE27_07925 [Clostridia bacterium]|nr:hypothetical protein [Clostridia bacterium]